MDLLPSLYASACPLSMDVTNLSLCQFFSTWFASFAFFSTLILVKIHRKLQGYHLIMWCKSSEGTGDSITLPINLLHLWCWLIIGPSLKLLQSDASLRVTYIFYTGFEVLFHEVISKNGKYVLHLSTWVRCHSSVILSSHLWGHLQLYI